jgi:hypothetical protein
VAKNLIKKVYYAISSAILVAPAVVFAQQSNVVPPGIPWTLRDLLNVLGNFAQFMFIAGLAIAVIFIIWGGITYMTASGDDTKIATAKKRIIWGLVGAAIIIGVGAIIRTLQLIFQQQGPGFFGL